MRRRDFLALAGSGATAAAWPLVARAQQSPGTKRIGVVHGFASSSDRQGADNLAAFLRGLAGQGWERGQNVQVDARFTAGVRSEADDFVRELISLRPDVLVTFGTPATAAAFGVTRAIPIVFAVVTDPISDGFITNLARPDGNVTGFTTYFDGMGGKWLDLLREIAPAVTTAGVMFNPATAPGRGENYLRSIEAAAAGTGVKVVPLVVLSDEAIKVAVADLAKLPRAGLISEPDSFIAPRRVMLFEEVARHRLPAIYPFPFWAADGGLVGYGIDANERAFGAGNYAGLILKGARIADLPVQEPTQFQLVLNLKTARAVGITFPATLVFRADALIE